MADNTVFVDLPEVVRTLMMTVAVHNALYSYVYDCIHKLAVLLSVLSLLLLLMVMSCINLT